MRVNERPRPTTSDVIKFVLLTSEQIVLLVGNEVSVRIRSFKDWAYTRTIRLIHFAIASERRHLQCSISDINECASADSGRR